jgi:kinesin family protein 18/19
MSPKRRKITAKKGISFSPKKKTPSKRGVRWRDDTENGMLADFEKTPVQENTPDVAMSVSIIDDSPVLSAASATIPYIAEDSADSSPLPTPPEVTTLSTGPKRVNRMQQGFLSKKTPANASPPTSAQSSDSETSPLRSLDPSKASNRGSLLSYVETADDSSSSNLSADDMMTSKSEAARIGRVVRKVSPSGPVAAAAAHARTQRRRSPTATSYSPTGEVSLFTASHARRMVRSEKENATFSALSPRVTPVLKNAAVRRTTIGGGGIAITGTASMRLSGGSIGSGSKMRDSLVGGKTVWR